RQRSHSAGGCQPGFPALTKTTPAPWALPPLLRGNVKHSIISSSQHSSSDWSELTGLIGSPFVYCIRPPAQCLSCTSSPEWHLPAAASPRQGPAIRERTRQWLPV